jgi:hypothetical protein
MSRQLYNKSFDNPRFSQCPQCLFVLRVSSDIWRSLHRRARNAKDLYGIDQTACIRSCADRIPRER